MPEYINKQQILEKAKAHQGSPFGIPLIIEEIEKAEGIDIVRCGECKHFIEYSDEYKQKVEKADGDCYFKLLYSCDNQYSACKYNDFCSYGERGNA